MACRYFDRSALTAPVEHCQAEARLAKAWVSFVAGPGLLMVSPVLDLRVYIAVYPDQCQIAIPEHGICKIEPSRRRSR